MIIKGLELFTDKLDELKKFYSQTLELEMIRDDIRSFSVNCGESILTFSLSADFTKPFYHFAFNIPENKLAEAKGKISAILNLISLNGEDVFDFRSWNAHSIYFYDPSGNIVELIARHNLNNSSSEEFTGKSFLSVSEVGLPVCDVEKFFEKINREYKTPLFSGDKKEFCAAGNDDGLFIIVNEGRKWFPDCGPAKIFPLVINILSEKIREIEFENLPYKITSSLK
ncbi:MAG TPA: ring-cleaving dioxygenase [Ignavibacteria bacterium]|nr:ring-cleaving dioxygenase [Ignavibacteria bacterium]